MNKEKIWYYGGYPFVTGGIAAGCIMLTGLAMIVQHNHGKLAERVAKFSSNEPKEFLNYYRKEAKYNPVLLYKDIFTSLLNSYRESFREELISSQDV